MGVDSLMSTFRRGGGTGPESPTNTEEEEQGWTPGTARPRLCGAAASRRCGVGDKVDQRPWIRAAGHVNTVDGCWTGAKRSLRQVVLEQLDVHLQNNEYRARTQASTKVNSKYIADLNVKL